MREVLELLDFFVREKDSVRPAREGGLENSCMLYFNILEGGGSSPLFLILLNFTVMNIFRILYFST